MISERVEELIQGELDGINSPSETDELRELARTDSEIAATLADMRQMAENLNLLQQVDPPPYLRDRIMASIPEPRSRPSLAPSWFDSIRDAFSGLKARPALAYAYMFALGVLAGLAGYALLSGGEMETNEVAATIGGDRETDSVVLLDEVDLASNTSIVTARSMRAGDVVTVEISASGTDPVDVVLENVPQLDAFEWNEIDERSDTQLDAGSVWVTGIRSGSFTITMRPTEDPGPILVTVRQAGDPVETASLSIQS